SLDAFAGIEAVDVTFNFDQALLSLDNVELAPGVPVPFLPLSFEPGVGQNKVGFFYLNPLLAGSGALLRATFTALGATPPAGTFINPEVKINEDLQSLAAPLAVAVVPEPGSFVLILAGLTLLAGVMRRRTRRPAPVRSRY
ncbi:MAG: PEP-CTERM sorting domain-containing protein, partial [Betaproteobacteria bacterium]